MPRWPDIDGVSVVRLEGFEADRPPTDAEDVTFSLTFDAAPAADGESVELAFDGLATWCEVTLNGELILVNQTMFDSVVVEVGPLLRGAGNELVILCRALDGLLAATPRRPRQRWRTKVVRDGALRWFRTAIVGRAPGFAAGPPIGGPWRPVWLVRRRGAFLDYRLDARMDGTDGVVAVRGEGLPDGEV